MSVSGTNTSHVVQGVVSEGFTKEAIKEKKNEKDTIKL